MTISTDTTDNFGSSKNAPAVTIVIPSSTFHNPQP